MDSTGFLDRSIVVDGVERRYVVFRPLGHDAKKPTPAILFLHGMGESGTDGMFQLYNGLMPAILRDRSQWPFLAVFPQKPTHQGEWFDQKATIDAILAAVEAEFAIDPHKRYLTGLSQGGRGTMRLAKHLKWQFAAIAPVCGWADVETAVKELVDVPMWLFHGDADQAVPVKGSTDVHDAVTKAGGKPKITIYPGVGHNSWDNAYRDPELPKWLLSHSLD